MKPSRQIYFGALLMLSAVIANAQDSPPSADTPSGTVPLTSLIATVAKNTGMKFVLDPRVRAGVTLIGEKASSVTYDELLTILATYGFIAVKSGGYVQVLPDAYTREEPMPFVSGNEKLPDDQPVTAVMHVRSLPAAWLVPILRPLIPQWGHFAAMPCDNDLVIVDGFAAVRRIETIIKAMDSGAPITLQKCHYSMPQ
jgi:general secretion pathway protein D